MKRVLSILILITAFYFPSNGQIREILDNGEVLEYYSGMVFETLGESMYSYRFIYGRYPEDKQTLLDFHLEKAKVEEHVLFRGLLLDFENGSVEFEEDDDSDYTALLAKRDSLITVDLNNPENVLTVSGDTCTFTYAKATRELFYYGFDESVSDFKLRAIQCIGLTWASTTSRTATTPSSSLTTLKRRNGSKYPSFLSCRVLVTGWNSKMLSGREGD